MSNSTQGTTVAFTYDAWGRMVTKTQGDHLAAYRFRFGDKMTQIDSNFPDEAALVTMMYDGLGKRRYKYVSGTPNSTTYWWRWGMGWNVVNEYTDVESTWDWDPENLTATYVGSMAEITGANPSSGAYRYYSGDNLGSVRRIRAHDKSSLAQYEYTPYGAAYSQSGLALNRGFTGHKWDSEIAMYWAPYRHYLPNQARWLTRDPLPSTNLYYYSYDPINSVDVLGLQSGEPIYNGCSPDQQNQMNAQLDQYCNKLNSPGFCSCMQDDSGLGGEMKRMCDNRGSMVISCEKPDSPHCQKNECARGNIGSSGIYMCPAAFANPGCGPLGCSLMHEMAHNAGAPDDEEGGSRREGMAFNVGRCLGCT